VTAKNKLESVTIIATGASRTGSATVTVVP
jgi:hypothetical protein